MNGFVSKITKIKALLAQYKEHAKKETKGIFHDNKHLEAINFIEQQLNLNDFMTVSELEKAILFLEKIRVYGKDEKKSVDLKTVISNNFNNRILDSSGNEDSQQSNENNQRQQNILIHQNSSLLRFLVEIHNTLLNNHELAKAHAQDEIPVSEIHYDSDLIKETQIAHDIEATTQSATASDESTSIFDIRRGGMTFYGAKIDTGENDIYAFSTIEGFAGDSIAKQGSKANKIYNFGGQILHGIILDEFENSMELIDGENRLIDGVKPAIVRGNINWSKRPDSNEIYATVELKILACAYVDPNDIGKLPEHYAIRSDGVTLDKIDLETLKKIQNARKNENDVVPICTFKAELDLIKDKKTWEHYLKMSSFDVKINTPDLISRKDPNYEPQPGLDYTV